MLIESPQPRPTPLEQSVSDHVARWARSSTMRPILFYCDIHPAA
jgi:hypothetical protein